VSKEGRRQRAEGRRKKKRLLGRGKKRKGKDAGTRREGDRKDKGDKADKEENLLNYLLSSFFTTELLSSYLIADS